MPNYGRSGRCLTCRRRRVKCDETRPACLPCRRLGLSCEGYSKEYAFRDETHKFNSTVTLRTPKAQRTLVKHAAASGEPSRSLLVAADIAVPFFLAYYAGTGRSLVAARGFYETLIPVYTSQPHDSPLSLAVSAVALKVYSFWRHEDTAHVIRYSASYTDALASLRAALECPQARRESATALAVLALHLFESISALYDARMAMPVHHHGALSLLPIATLDKLDDVISKYVKGFVIHTEISSALRQKRSMHSNAYLYVNSPHTSFFVPGNLSIALDSIGACVAELQADYVRTLSQQQSSGPSLKQQCRTWITNAEHIHERLQGWAHLVPDHWQPLRLTSGQDFDSSIATYRSACDIYLSCQIATLWNLWRFHCLLLDMIVANATRISSCTQDKSAGDAQPTPLCEESAAHTDSIQQLVDSICYSVPFYLGNRVRQCSLNDFADSTILFPSYHNLTPGDARIAGGHHGRDDCALSSNEHQRHVLAYGAWHIVSPLSNLLTLFSDDHGGQLVANCLRLGQQDWIREQFLRVSTLVRLPMAGSRRAEEDHKPSSLVPAITMSTDSPAEILARQVRQGAIFMSGP